MNYSKFLEKKAYKNLTNIVPLVLVVIFLVIIYGLSSYKAKSDVSFSMEQIEILKNDVIFFEESINKIEKESAYEVNQKNLALAKERLENQEQGYRALMDQDWEAYYTYSAKNEKEFLDFIKTEPTFNEQDEISRILEANYQYAVYMSEHSIGFDNRFDPTQGISYLLKAMNDYIPYLFSIVYIFIISSIFCSIFIEKNDIHSLLPISNFKKNFTRLTVATLIGVFVTLVLVAVPIMCGTIGNTLGNQDSPILTYNEQGITSFIPFRALFIQLVVLHMLSILFIGNLIAFLSVLTINRKKCMTLGLFIVIGGILITTNIVPLYSVFHLLPTTYLNSFKVLSGELMYITGNANITFTNACSALIIGSFVLFVLYCCSLTIRNMKVRN